MANHGCEMHVFDSEHAASLTDIAGPKSNEVWRGSDSCFQPLSGHDLSANHVHLEGTKA